jgi:hypothetical protein
MLRKRVEDKQLLEMLCTTQDTPQATDPNTSMTRITFSEFYVDRASTSSISRRLSSIHDSVCTSHVVLQDMSDIVGKLKPFSG